MKSENVDEEEDREEYVRQWASYRGQTLSRTVRGMMYYWQALLLQYLIENSGDYGEFSISHAVFQIQITET